MFAAVKNLLPDNEAEQVVLDFEAAMWGGIRELFPERSLMRFSLDTGSVQACAVSRTTASIPQGPRDQDLCAEVDGLGVCARRIYPEAASAPVLHSPR